MGCKEETRIIGNNSYYCLQWDARKAILMKLKLAKTFGPFFSDLTIAIANDYYDQATGAIEKLFTGNNSPESVLELLEEIVMCATCNGKKINIGNFNEIFGDNLLEFYKVFIFVLEVNYKSFLGGSLSGGLTEKLEKIKTILG